MWKTLGLAVLASALLPSLSRAQPRPIAVFINGNNDCCSWRMHDTMDVITSELGGEVMVVPWNHFTDGGSQWSQPLNDAAFLAGLGTFVNNLPDGRPVILVGHSFGGDSLLKAVGGTSSGIGARIRADRKLLAVATMDPTSTGGLRMTASGYYRVPSNVDLFFNRWQHVSAPPFNFLDDGKIADCKAAACDQTAQAYERYADGTIKRDWFRRPLLLAHSDVPSDDFIEAQLIRQIRERLAKRTIVTLKSDGYQTFLVAEGGGGGALNANRPAAFEWEHFELVDLDGGGFASGGEVALVSHEGYFVAIAPDGKMSAASKRLTPECRFRIEKWGGGQLVDGDGVWIRTSVGDFVVVGADGVSARHQSTMPSYAWKWIVDFKDPLSN